MIAPCAFHIVNFRTIRYWAGLKRTIMSSFEVENPLIQEWETEFGLPPFKSILPSHFTPAFDQAFKEHLDELSAIVQNSSIPTFENTFSAFDRSGYLMNKVSALFTNLCSSHAPPDLQSIQKLMASPQAAHKSAIYTFPGLFHKIDTIHHQRFHMNLSDVQIRLVERVYLDFIRAGARFEPAVQARHTQVMKSLAELTTQFGQNVLADEAKVFITLGDDELTGLPKFVVTAAKQAAIERGMSDSYVITLSRSLVVPFLTFSDRRDLRERAWRLWTNRGELDPERDNNALVLQILRLRAEQARLHGYDNYAQFATADTMAGTPEAVNELLHRVWPKAKESAERERQALEEYVSSCSTAASSLSPSGEQGESSRQGERVTIEAWDWRYYAEKVRQTRYNMDQSELKPYLQLDKMRDAAFDCAHQLFGLSFRARPDIDTYHPDVSVYEVYEEISDLEGQIASELGLAPGGTQCEPEGQPQAGNKDATDDGEGCLRGYRGGDDDGKAELDKRKKREKLVAIFLHDNFSRLYKRSGARMSHYRMQSRNEGPGGEHVIPIVVNCNNFIKGAEGEPVLLSFDDVRTLFHEFG